MIKQIKKLKAKSILTIILALLAITWQFLNYLTIKDFLSLYNVSSINVIIIYSSYFFVAILFFSILSLVFTAFRVSIKFNSDQKKLAKEKNQVNNKAIDAKPLNNLDSKK
jgi:uncharacterized membrane protein